MKDRKSLHDFRENYTKGGLTESMLLKDPIAMFKLWMDEAINAELPEPNAMVISTLSPDGFPSGRVVLLKDILDGTFIFYTNYGSDKAIEMEQHPKVSITFLWKELERQIRIKGKCSKVDEATSEAYFHKRPRGSQLGAWVSPQSTVIPNRTYIEEKQKHYEELYADEAHIPKPPHWGGYAVSPVAIEFWQGRPSRLHDRLLYPDDNGNWKINRLAP